MGSAGLSDLLHIHSHKEKELGEGQAGGWENEEFFMWFQISNGPAYLFWVICCSRDDLTSGSIVQQ